MGITPILCFYNSSCLETCQSVEISILNGCTITQLLSTLYNMELKKEGEYILYFNNFFLPNLTLIKQNK